MLPERRDRDLVRLEVGRRPGDEKPSLPCLRILEKRERGLELVPHLEGMLDPLPGILQGELTMIRDPSDEAEGQAGAGEPQNAQAPCLRVSHHACRA